MKNSEVVIGKKYVARVSGLITVVEILDKGHPKGWIAKNLRTNREVYFKTGGRLWKAATKESMMSYLGFVPMPRSDECSKSTKPTYDELAEALVDVVDKITRHKGLSLDRCEEIIEIRNKLVDIIE